MKPFSAEVLISLGLTTRPWKGPNCVPRGISGRTVNTPQCSVPAMYVRRSCKPTHRAHLLHCVHCHLLPAEVFANDSHRSSNPPFHKITPVPARSHILASTKFPWERIHRYSYCRDPHAHGFQGGYSGRLRLSFRLSICLYVFFSETL